MAFRCAFSSGPDPLVPETYNFNYVKNNAGVYRINSAIYTARYISFGFGMVVRCYPDNSEMTTKVLDTSGWENYRFVRVDEEVVLTMNNRAG